MPTSIAASYDEKLKKWIKYLNACIEDVAIVEQLLEDVIRRDNIVNIAAKVEVHQLMLEGVTAKINDMLSHMRNFRKNLYEEEELIDDMSITKLIEEEMKLIGNAQSKLEHEYSSLKTQCDHFLAEMLKSKK